MKGKNRGVRQQKKFINQFSLILNAFLFLNVKIIKIHSMKYASWSFVI